MDYYWKAGKLWEAHQVNLCYFDIRTNCQRNLGTIKKEDDAKNHELDSKRQKHLSELEDALNLAIQEMLQVEQKAIHLLHTKVSDNSSLADLFNKALNVLRDIEQGAQF